MSSDSDTERQIIGWHCHIYFDMEQRDDAIQLCNAVQDRFAIWDYRWLDKPNGLHPTPMFRFQFRTEDLSDYLHWITLNRRGLSVLIHAITGDDLFDHEHNPMWLGKPLVLGIDALRRYQERMRKGELPREFLQAEQAAAKEMAGKIRYEPGVDPHQVQLGRDPHAGASN